jgi:hypothetical protein
MCFSQFNKSKLFNIYRVNQTKEALGDRFHEYGRWFAADHPG